MLNWIRSSLRQVAQTLPEKFLGIYGWSDVGSTWVSGCRVSQQNHGEMIQAGFEVDAVVLYNYNSHGHWMVLLTLYSFRQ